MQRRYFLKAAGGALAGCMCGLGRAGATEKPRWSYEGETGPDNWGGLASRFEACGIGNQQSPVDIARAEPAELPEIGIHWRRPAGELVNNGETIKIYPEDGGSIALWGAEYEFLQAHFHTPSEHQLSGKPFPMEAHFVHRHVPTDTLAVLGVFLAGGGEHAGFSTLMRAASAAEGERVRLPEGLDLSTLLPEKRAYWSYTGSLTTPPCDEIVRWIVFQAPVRVNDTDIAHFRALYPMNARPVQRLLDRSVYLSE